MRGVGIVAAAAVVGVGLGLGLGAGATGAETKRTLLGTIRSSGAVEAGLPGQDWRPLTGGALVEGMRIRTAAKDSAAVLTLASGDVLGLAEGTVCEVGTSRPVRVRLLEGKLALRLRADSPLVVDAGAASVRAPAATPAATGATREALLTLRDGTAVLATYRGAFELTGTGDGTPVQVAAGQQATVLPQGGAPAVSSAPSGKAAAAGAAGGGGALAALGISETTAAVIGGGVAVVGGLGGAAAAGAFSGDGDSGDDTGGAQGSPFRP